MQYLKEAFSEANLELVNRCVFRGEDVKKVVREMREEGKFSSESDEEEESSDEEELGVDEEEKSPTLQQKMDK